MIKALIIRSHSTGARWAPEEKVFTAINQQAGVTT
jgi:hypothetical protein